MKTCLNNIWKLVILFAVISTLGTCKKDEPMPPIDETPEEVDIFIAGYESNGNVAVAKYWENGVGTALNDGTKNSCAFDIAVVGNDIYICGYEANNSTNKLEAIFWKNGIPSLLTDGTQDAEAKAIVVSGNDVYVAGHDGVNAKYWKNGVETLLKINSDEQISSIEINSMTVDNNDIYIVGYFQYRSKDSYGTSFYQFKGICDFGYRNMDGGGTVRKAICWKNGNIINSTNEIANDIAINGNDIYVVGEGNGNCVCWKNGVEYIPNNSFRNGIATGIEISKNNIYISGVEHWSLYSSIRYFGYTHSANYWKNDIKFPLEKFIGVYENGNDLHAYSIAVNEEDVYVAGCSWFTNKSKKIAKYWKNAVAHELTDGTNDAEAYAIVVQKRN